MRKILLLSVRVYEIGVGVVADTYFFWNKYSWSLMYIQGKSSNFARKGRKSSIIARHEKTDARRNSNFARHEKVDARRAIKFARFEKVDARRAIKFARFGKTDARKC